MVGVDCISNFYPLSDCLSFRISEIAKLPIQRTFAAVGVDPSIMRIGPAIAIPVAVKSAGLELEDIDFFEINEAFASQYVYCRKKLELDPNKINVNGGAMAMWHPLSATEYPAITRIGPAVAIPAAVKSAGLELEDIDLFEINEAFASQ